MVQNGGGHFLKWLDSNWNYISQSDIASQNTLFKFNCKWLKTTWGCTNSFFVLLSKRRVLYGQYHLAVNHKTDLQVLTTFNITTTSKQAFLAILKPMFAAQFIAKVLHYPMIVFVVHYR